MLLGRVSRPSQCFVFSLFTRGDHPPNGVPKIERPSKDIPLQLVFGVRKWQQRRSSIICMCPCLIEDIKQGVRLIIAFIQSLDLGKVHYVI